jgi:hypothetical protein
MGGRGRGIACRIVRKSVLEAAAHGLHARKHKSRAPADLPIAATSAKKADPSAPGLRVSRDAVFRMGVMVSHLPKSSFMRDHGAAARRLTYRDFAFAKLRARSGYPCFSAFGFQDRAEGFQDRLRSSRSGALGSANGAVELPCARDPVEKGDVATCRVREVGF